MKKTAALWCLLLILAGCGGTAASQHAAAPASPTAAASRTPSQGATAAPTHVGVRTASWRLPVPSARQALVAEPGQHVLLAGGMLTGDVSTGDVHRIDLTTGKATRAPSLLVPVHDAAGGLYDGQPAVFGGGNATEQSLVQSLTGVRWRKVDEFPSTRSDLSTVTLPDRTVVLGGYDGTGTPRAVYTQAGQAQMRVTGRLVRGVRYAATAAVGHDIYVFGGEVNHAELSTVQRFDTSTGHVQVVAMLPHPLGHAMAATVGDRVLLMGGHPDAGSRSAAVWWFDPASGRFTHAATLPRPLSDAAVAVSGSTVWLLGGEDPGVTDRVVVLVAH